MTDLQALKQRVESQAAQDVLAERRRQVESTAQVLHVLLSGITQWADASDDRKAEMRRLSAAVVLHLEGCDLLVERPEPREWR